MTWKRNTTEITEYNTRYSNEISEYKAFAEKRRNNRVYKQEQMFSLIEKLSDYVETKHRENKPLTVAGMLLAIGWNTDVWRRARDGDYDYLLEEYISLNDIKDSDVQDADGLPYVSTANGNVSLIPYSLFVEKASLLIQEEREEKCSSTRGNPAGNIFLLKAQHGFREEDTPTTVNQTLVIADREQATEALKLLDF